jgi:hypothetical protein
VRTLNPATVSPSTPRSQWPLPVVGGLSLVFAAATFVLPAVNGYDPWSWLVWGREITAGTLDTTGGPSWKPLPVVATVAFAPFGDAAPWLWLLVTRALAFMAVAFTFRLAARYAGVVAGLVAVGLLVLAPDPDPRFVRLVLEGHSGIATLTFALWAFERHLDRRFAHAVLLGTALALLRPEAWPFLGVYALWVWRDQPRLRPLVVGCIASIPLLWFVPDWIGSGSPWHGADAAQVAFRDTTNRIELALRRAGELVLLPAWIAAAAGIVSAVRRRERALVVAAGAAAVWVAMVIAMTAVFHYAALSRFFLPAVGVACILAGIGAVRAVGAVPAGAPRALAVAALVAIIAFAATPRVLGIPDVLDEVREQAKVEDDLLDVIDQLGGSETLLDCGPVSVDGWGGMRPALAWHLGEPLSRLGYGPLDAEGIVLARPDSRRHGTLTLLADPEITVLATNDRWVVYGIGCPSDPTTSS